MPFDSTKFMEHLTDLMREHGFTNAVFIALNIDKEIKVLDIDLPFETVTLDGVDMTKQFHLMSKIICAEVLPSLFTIGEERSGEKGIVPPKFKRN